MYAWLYAWGKIDQYYHIEKQGFQLGLLNGIWYYLLWGLVVHSLI